MHRALCIAHCELFIVYGAFRILLFQLCTVDCAFCIIHCELRIVNFHFALIIAHCALYIVYCALCILQFLISIVHCAFCIVHFFHFIVSGAPELCQAVFCRLAEDRASASGTAKSSHMTAKLHSSVYPLDGQILLSHNSAKAHSPI